MIEIKITGEDYEQDIRPLVKSFYPDDVIVIAGKEREESEEQPDKFLTLMIEPEQCHICFQAEDRVYEETEDFSELLPNVYKNEGTPDRRMYRNYLHRRLYGILAKETGKELPWGTLTGIRPTKQALERLLQKNLKKLLQIISKRSIFVLMKRQNFVSGLPKMNKNCSMELKIKIVTAFISEFRFAQVFVCIVRSALIR